MEKEGGKEKEKEGEGRKEGRRRKEGEKEKEGGRRKRKEGRREKEKEWHKAPERELQTGLLLTPRHAPRAPARPSLRWRMDVPLLKRARPRPGPQAAASAGKAVPAIPGETRPETGGGAEQRH